MFGSESSSSAAAVEDQQKASDELRKDVSELGIEVIDQISAAAGSYYYTILQQEYSNVFSRFVQLDTIAEQYSAWYCCIVWMFV